MIIYWFLGCLALFIIWASIKIESELYKINPKKVCKIEKWIFNKFFK